jgi:hypothetical protein
MPMTVGTPWRTQEGGLARTIAASNVFESAAARLSVWLNLDLDLLRGIVRLRELGPENDELIHLILDQTGLEVVQANWRLWAAIVEAEGKDWRGLLRPHMSDAALHIAAAALCL